MPADEGEVRSENVRRPDLRTLALPFFLGLAALALWLVSLPFIDLARISGWGLFPALPVTWFFAFGLAGLGAAAAVQQRVPARVFWLCLAVLILIVFGTTSAVYEIPRYPWTYKHIGVVEEMLASNVLTTGHLDRTIDIYHNWPGFFLLAALVSTVTSVSPLGVAQWAEPVFAFASALAVAYAVSALTRDQRRVRLAVVLFVLANWIGTNYYSPQALATVLASLFLGVVLRILPVRDDEGNPILRRIPARMLGSRSVVGLPSPESDFVVRHRVFGLLLATALWTGLVVTHQLTPVAVALQLGALFVMIRLRPWWMLFIWAALEGAWVLLALRYLTERQTLFQRDAITDIRWPGTQLTPSLPGMEFVGAAGPLLEVAMPLAGLLVAGWFVWRRRQLHLIPLLLGFAPPFLLAVQTYGGEAVFRVYLYGLPWFSSLIALGVLSLVGREWYRRVAMAAAGTLMLALAAMANLGQELVNHVVPSDLTASVWFENNTPPGSQAVSLAALGFPSQSTRFYPTHTTKVPTLSDVWGFPPLSEGPQTALDGVVSILQIGGVRSGYVAVDTHAQTYAKMYGLATQPQFDEFFAALRRAPDWKVVYDSDGTIIAEYMGDRTGPR